jgi:DNA-binding NtrC family response regulator
VRFAIPPLCQRREDIAPLAQCLLDRLCARYQQRPVVLGTGALARLLEHAWPGNVRELASVLEAALLEADNGVIRAVDLVFSPSLEETGPPGAGSLLTGPRKWRGGSEFGNWESSPLHGESFTLDAVINRHVQAVLDLNRGNKLRAAKQLGISRSTLYRILGNEAVLAH